MIRRSGKRGNYAYTVARVKSKKAQLLKKEDYNKMLMMTVPEITRYVSETSSYARDVIELADRFEGLNLLEHALNKSMANVFQDIMSGSQGELKTMVKAYLRQYDYWNLKVILRGQTYGLDAGKIREDLIPAGGISAETLDKLVSYENTDEMLAAFAGAAHIQVPANIISASKASGNLGEIEDYLDKTYYAELLESIPRGSRPASIFLNYVKHEIDLRNLETILKLKKDKIPADVVMGYYIPGGYEIDQRLATNLANMDHMADILGAVSGLSFYEDARAAMDKEAATSGRPASTANLAFIMRKYHLAEAKKFSHMYPLSVLPVIDFLIHKRVEVSNIRIIARGIESGLDREQIESLLVIE